MISILLCLILLIACLIGFVAWVELAERELLEKFPLNEEEEE